MREKPGEGVREMSKRKKFNCRKIVKNGVLQISGEVSALVYSSKKSKEKGFLKRVFGA